jgi:hypothetical protein
MNPVKRTFVFVILGVMLVLFGGYTTLDWFQYIKGIVDFSHPEIPYVRATKVAVSFLSAILVFMVGRDGFDRKDTRRLFIVYAVIFIGDIFLVLDVNLAGIGVFALAHVCFIVRNGAGISGYLRNGNRKDRMWDVLTGIIVAGIIVAVMSGLFYPLLGGNFFFYALLGYGIILCISVWAAWAAVRIRYMPSANAWLTAVGLTCFMVSDLLVGVHFATQPGAPQAAAIYVTWLFYTPALVLPALSGYNLKRLMS